MNLVYVGLAAAGIVVGVRALTVSAHRKEVQNMAIRKANTRRQYAAYQAAIEQETLSRENYHADLEFDFHAPPVSTTAVYDDEMWESAAPAAPPKAWEWEGIPLRGRCVDEFSVGFGNWLNTPAGKFAAYIAEKERS